MHSMHPHDELPSFWRSRLGLGWLTLAAVAAWFLWTEHRVHLLGALPYLILLACPLMHVFMHHGHHGNSHGHGPSPDRDAAKERRDQDAPGARP